MPKGAIFERSRRELAFEEMENNNSRELFLDVSVGVHILLLFVEQSSLERQSRGCAKTPILTILPLPPPLSFPFRGFVALILTRSNAIGSVSSQL